MELLYVTRKTMSAPPPRRSKRDTNRIVLASSRNGSLPYQRMENLFFDETVTKLRSEKEKDQQSGVVRVSKMHLKRVYTAPNIYVIDDFLTAADLRFLSLVIQQDQQRFQRSYVDNENSTLLDDTHRTSTFLSFAKQENAKVAALEQRAAALMGYYSTDQIEPLQLVRYLPGQFFGVHHDMGDLDEDTKQVALPHKNVLVKRRLVTIFCYLNDLPVEAGGCTYFPECSNLKVKPKKGRAVVFCNVTKEGLPDPRTVHAGDPVVSSGHESKKGESSNVKYGLNIWVCES